MTFKKIFLAIAILAVFGGLFGANVPTAKALTSAEIQNLIAQLQNQILQLQKQLAEIQDEPAAWCHNFNASLRIGDSGSEITALQRALQKQGFYQRDINGNFDEYTASAVVGFQEKYHSETLAPWGLARGTGFVGGTTRVKLNKLYGCESASVPTPSPTPSPTPTMSFWVKSVEGVQANYKPGQSVQLMIDGVESDGTIAAKSEGFNVQVYVFDSNRTKTYTAMNATFVSAAGAWKADFITPTDQAKSYDLQVTLYCSSSLASSACVANYGGVRGGGKQDVRTYRFNVIQPSTSPSITVTSPNGGEEWEVGKNYEVKIYCSGLSKTIDIWLTNKYAEAWNVAKIASDTTCRLNATSIYNFTAPSITVPTSQNSFKVVAKTIDGAVQDESDNYFMISAATAFRPLKVSYPNGGETFYGGDTMIISWTHSTETRGETVKLNIKLLGDDGVGGYTKIIENIVTNQNVGVSTASQSGGEWAWTVPTSLASGKYKIQVDEVASNGVHYIDTSDSYFRITNMPDLVPTPISYTEGKILLPGDTVYFDSGIQNKGSVATRNFNIKWFVDGIQKGYGAHSGVPANTTLLDDNSQFYWTAEEGTHTIQFLVDADDYVIESNEGNNSLSVAVTVKFPPVSVISPNGGEVWKAGDVRTISWDGGSPNKDNSIRLVDADIPFSQTVNFSYYVLKRAENPAGLSSNSFNWNVGDADCPSCALKNLVIYPGKYKVRIVGPDGQYDESNSSFEIISGNPAPIKVTSPNGGEQFAKDGSIPVQWQYNNPQAYANKTIRVELWKGDEYLSSKSLIGSQTSYNLSSAGLSAGNDYYVWVVDASTISYSDKSDNYFSITEAPSLSVTYPNGGETLTVGNTYTIRWNTAGYSATTPVQIGLRDARYDPNISEITIANTTNSGSYSWTVPATVETTTEKPGPTHQIVIYIEGGGPGKYDLSDNYFSIIDNKSITVTSPNGGENWAKGSTHDITWTSSGIEKVHIDVAKFEEKSSSYTLISNLPASSGKWSWTIGEKWPVLTDGDRYRIRVFEYPLGSNLYDQSDNYFSITTTLGLNSLEDQLASVAEATNRLLEEVKELIK